MDKELLKSKIIELYSQPAGYYTSELADRFDVEPKEIVRAIKELEEEGKFMQREVWVEPGTIVYEKIKKDPHAFEKLIKLCNERPIKMSKKEFMQWAEQ